MGPVLMTGPPWRIDGFTPPPATRGPKLGEHNDYVFRELLGLKPSEIDMLKASGVIS
jgi:benzylsuccinate CoA-transferase BbsF subunit